jgi:hypothetical protein
MNSDYNLPTYLCDYVNELINSINQRDENLVEDLIWNQNTTFDVDYIARICLKYNNENSIDYYSSSKILSKNLYLICKKLLKPNINFNTQFSFIKNFITQDNDLNLIKKCFENSTSTLNNAQIHQIQVYISLLNIFVIFERYLRQLIVTLTCSGDKTEAGNLNQFLLRDLISNKILEKVLNRNLINLIKCLIGSPYSLNLRNLLWHGFLQINECSHYYEYFLLIILDKIGQEMEQQQKHQKFAESRLQVKKIENYQIRSLNAEYKFNDSLIEIKNNINVYLSIINDSILINDSQKMLLSFIINNLFIIQKSYIQTILSLLPQIEFLLRKLYIIENRLDFKFNLSAQEKFFYLTMDEIMLEFILPVNSESKILLKKLVDNEPATTSGIKNRLPLKLGNEFMILLNDLFMYNDGPRIRDRLSHGEYELTYDQKNEEKYGIYAVLSIYSIINLVKTSTTSTKLAYESFISDYKCSYHPLACIKYDLINLIGIFELNFMNKGLILNEKCFKMIEKLKIDNFYTFTTMDSLVKYLESESFNSKYLFLYSKISNQLDMNNSLQIINLIKHLVKECCLFLDTIYSYYQITMIKYDTKQLRTRQRETFKFFQENSIANYEMNSYRLILILVYLFFKLLSLVNNNGKIDYVKFLKKLLTIFQNLTQQSKINRWLECNQLNVELDKIFDEFY